MAEKHYLDLEGLKLYNTKIKKFITDNDLTEADVTALITSNTKALSDQVAANLAAITLLVGTDANKSVRTVASEEVAKIVAGADESYDTLKEIADWIKAHPDTVSAINKEIAAIKTSLGTIAEDSTVAGLIDGLTTRMTAAETSLNEFKAITEEEIDTIMTGEA